MSVELKISPLGLKLIKAFEGYRENATSLATGQRVIGYGHPLDDTETMKPLSKEAADKLLREDLAPVEQMVRETIFTPLSQSQFDALVSLVFNIGPINFMTSNLRHALNNGRTLDAAAAFDEWRKADIDGRTYVVDALVRRRTAEKALFLRSERPVLQASQAGLSIQSDHSYTRISDDEVYGTGAGVINPQQADSEPRRRADDDAVSVLTLTERAQATPEAKTQGRVAAPTNLQAETDETLVSRPEHLNEYQDKALNIPHPNGEIEDPSPIAMAAAEVSERLDALIDTARIESKPKRKKKGKATKLETPLAANGNNGRARRAQPATASTAEKFITRDVKPTKAANTTHSNSAYGIFMVLGGCLASAGAVMWMTARERLGEMGEFLAPWAIVFGGALFLGGLYYGLKGLRKPQSSLKGSNLQTAE